MALRENVFLRRYFREGTPADAPAGQRRSRARHAARERDRLRPPDPVPDVRSPQPRGPDVERRRDRARPWMRTASRDSGRRLRGPTSPARRPTDVVEHLAQVLWPAVRGAAAPDLATPADLEAVERLVPDVGPAPGRHHAARAALELALVDCGAPAPGRLGGRPSFRRVAARSSTEGRSPRSRQTGRPAQARWARLAGLRQVKVKVGVGDDVARVGRGAGRAGRRRDDPGRRQRRLDARRGPVRGDRPRPVRGRQPGAADPPGAPEILARPPGASARCRSWRTSPW